MTRENLISKERHQKSPTYGNVAKLFLESEFQHKGNKQMKKNVNSKRNFVVFSAATDSEHRNSSNTTQKRTKQNLVSIFIDRTGIYL